MPQSNNDSEKSRLLIELVNFELRDDLANVLVLLSSKKQNFTHLKAYEAKKKFLVDLFETERIVNIKHVNRHFFSSHLFIYIQCQRLEFSH